MKKFLLFMAMLLLTGCATYKFQKGSPPYDKGYVVARADYAIVEYTLGEDNTAPPLALARERFRRRKQVVEDHYKRMGYIQNRFKEQALDRVLIFIKLIGSVFSAPGRIISAYKYENNPEYRQKVDRIEAEKIAQEEARIKKLKEELGSYIQRDISKEKQLLMAQ